MYQVQRTYKTHFIQIFGDRKLHADKRYDKGYDFSCGVPLLNCINGSLSKISGLPDFF